MVVFTDGACENEDDDNYVASAGGVIYLRNKKPMYFGGRLPDKLVEQWRRNKRHIIGLVELYAVVLARSVWKEFLHGQKIIYFIDNIPAMRALIRGTSSDVSWRAVLLKYEELEMVSQTFPWMARVASKSNIADWPGRNEEHRLIGMYHSEGLLYSFSNVCRDFTICFPQNILDQGDIQMRDLKISWFGFHVTLTCSLWAV